MDPKVTFSESELRYDSQVEKSKQFIHNAIEVVLSSGDFQREINSHSTPQMILDKTAERIGQLVRFESSGLYIVDQETSDIRLSVCTPDDSKEIIEDEIEFLIDNGFIAWAMRERRGVTVFSKDGRHRVLLHVIATYSHTWGLFIGVFPSQLKRLPDASLEFLSIILRNAANGLESVTLQHQLLNQKGELQKKVDEKAQKLIRYERKLLQIQKMDAIAELAGGIAHQFNNALAGLIGNLDLAEMVLEQDSNSKAIGYIERTRPLVKRMTDLTKQFLVYAQGGHYQPNRMSFNQFADTALPVIQSSINPAFQVYCDIPGDISKVNLDSAQMQIALTAIVDNAVEAMEGGGEIRISATNARISDGDQVFGTELEAGCYVCLSIQDTGSGMDYKTRSRVFEPFFSTKFAGRGLSMAAVFSIVKNHQGWIGLDTEVGKGTIVHIYLPAV